MTTTGRGSAILLGSTWATATRSRATTPTRTGSTTSGPSPNAARDSILANHEVIAFKSCYPASHIDSDAKLAQYQAWYLSMRDVFDAHPDRIFVVMSPPPLHRLDTNLGEADRTRAFALWLGSAGYPCGASEHRGTSTCSTRFARPSDGSATRNMLRYEYELDHGSGDSHPNALANQSRGAALRRFVIRPRGTPRGSRKRSLLRATAEICSVQPNPVRDSATILYGTAAPGWVRLDLFDATGRLLRTLSDRREAAGTHEVGWVLSSREVAIGSGTYWVRLARENGTAESLSLTVLR